MIEAAQLVLPVLLGAVAVFLASSVIHMVVRWHNPDYRALANEDAVAAALREGCVEPGQYILPHCLDPEAAGDPAIQERFGKGPVAVVYVKPNGFPAMGPLLGKWFAYTLVVSAVVAYLARAHLPAGAPGASVFRFVTVVAWLAYAWQGPADSIWKGKPWAVTGKEMVDGLVYAACTGAVFVWLWPQA